MSPRRGTVVAGSMLLLASCSLPLGSGGRLVLPVEGDLAAQARQVAERARTAEVVYLGEHHDNPHHHARQARVLELLLADGRRPALAFEMLEEQQQAVVSEAIQARPTEQELEARLRWTARGWPDFRWYWPLFELALRHALPVVATDLDRAIARRIGREGLEALGEGRGALASLLPPDAAREARIADTIRKAHCDLLPERQIPRMVESWHARNVTMARRLAEALRGREQVVVIAGRGHQDPGGLPEQLAAIRPGTRQLVVDMPEVGPPGGPEAGPGAVAADIVWLTPGVERPDPCAPLRRRDPAPPSEPRQGAPSATPRPRSSPPASAS